MHSRIFIGISTLAIAGALTMLPPMEIAPARADTASNSTNIYCGSVGQNPATIISAPGYDPIPLIVWSQQPGADFGPEYTPPVRCNIVSSKAQDYWNRGLLTSFTTGNANGYPVICVAAQSGGPCAGTLFTLRLNANPSQTLRELFTAYQTGDVIYQSDGRLYIDLQDILDDAVAASEPSPTDPLDSVPPSRSGIETDTLCPGPLCRAPQ